jgi:hypothetical protein
MPAPSGEWLRAELGLKLNGATLLILDVQRRTRAGWTSGARPGRLCNRDAMMAGTGLPVPKDAKRKTDTTNQH